MATITQSPARRLLDSTSAPVTDSSQRLFSWLQRLGALAILVAVLVGFNIFITQVFLYPQVRDYHANWHGAAWIQVPNSTGSVGYFHKDFTLETTPDSAFMTVEGQQTYNLYVNGQPLDNTAIDFRNGVIFDTNIYDIAPFLTTGLNTVAIRVVNADAGAAAIRAVLGITIAGQTQYFPTDTSWRATSDVTLTNLFLSTQTGSYVYPTFDDTAWSNAALYSGVPPRDGIIPFNPATFELPMPTQWYAAGPYQDGYYFRTVNLPATNEVWMRVSATGDATIYLNGQRIIEQPVRIPLDQTNTSPPSHVQITTGIFDVSPYLHSGLNTVAVHVASNSFSPGTNTLSTQESAMTLDLLAVRQDGSIEQLGNDAAWTASAQSTPGWTTGTGSAQWGAANIVAGDTVSTQPPYKIPALVIESPDTVTLVIWYVLISLVGLLCIVAGITLLLRFRVADGSFARRLDASLELMAVAMAPVLALMILLWIISFEPILPRPFPATPFWLGVTIALAVIAYLFVFAFAGAKPVRTFTESAKARLANHPRLRLALVLSPVVLMLLVGAYCVFYQLGYENFWQDELASIYAAKGVMTTGLPAWPTGILYTKAELFTYLLAIPMALFGFGPYALRSLSALEYLASLAMIYWLGRYFFNRWVGLLAMGIALFSNIELYWGRQARMYQQAQLMFLVVLFLFYRALRREAKPRDIYLAMAAVVVMYLSHEETFIVLPAILGYFLIVLIREKRDFLQNKHWWIAGSGAAIIIVGQLVIWRLTRHPIIGTDRTERPLIGWHPENIFYYARLLFFSRSERNETLADLGDVSLIAMIALLLSMFSRKRELRYLSFFLGVSLITLSTMLSITDVRYVYSIQPIIYLLAAWLLVSIIQFIGTLANRRLPTVAGRALVILTAALVVITILGDPTPSWSTFSLATSRTFGLPYQHRIPDYVDAGNYIKAHWQPGDIIISMAPANDVMFYIGKPTYSVYTSQVLYVFEQNGHITNSYVGSQMIINQNDFNAVLAKYHRIWIVVVSGGNNTIGIAGSTPILTNFQEVYEDAGAFVYLRTG